MGGGDKFRKKKEKVKADLLFCILHYVLSPVKFYKIH